MNITTLTRAVGRLAAFLKAMLPSLPRQYRLLMWLTVVEMVGVMVCVIFWGGETVDTKGYLIAYDTLKSGRLDVCRTPVYPLVIGAARDLLGETGGEITVCALQATLFLLSTAWFGKLARAMVSNPKVALAVTAIYSLSPGPMSLCFFQLTEVFAFSGVVLLLLLTAKGYRADDLWAALWSMPLMLALFLLRPALIYLPVAFAMFWIAVALKRGCRRAVWLAGLSGCLLTAVCYQVYSSEVERLCGFKGMSVVAIVNTHFTVREAGLMRPREISNPRVKACAEYLLAREQDARKAGSEGMSGFTEVCIMMQVSSEGEVAAFQHEALSGHPRETLEYFAAKRLPAVCESDAIYGSGSILLLPVRIVTRYVSPNIGMTYLLFLIFVVMLLRRDMRRRELSAFSWLLAVLFVGCNAVVIIGAPAEWPRLLLPDLPVLLLITGITFTKICDVFWSPASEPRLG